MRKAVIYSALLHVTVLLVAWFGVPNLFRAPPPEDRPLIVEVLPLSAITNAPPPKPEPQRVAEAPPEPPKPEPPKPEPPKPPPPAPPPPAPPSPAPAPPAPPPPAPAPAPAPPAPRAEAPPPPPQPAPPRPEPPKPQQQAQTPQKRQQQFDLDNVLRDLTRRKPQAQTAPAKQEAQAPSEASSNAPHNPLLRLSMTEEDAIRQRVSSNWIWDPGAKDVDRFVVELRIFVLPDGTVRDVRVESGGAGSDERFRAFVEATRRAVLKSSPLPIPAEKAGQLIDGNLVLRFSAKEMLGAGG